MMIKLQVLSAGQNNKGEKLTGFTNAHMRNILSCNHTTFISVYFATVSSTATLNIAFRVRTDLLPLESKAHEIVFSLPFVYR